MTGTRESRSHARSSHTHIERGTDKQHEEEHASAAHVTPKSQAIVASRSLTLTLPLPLLLSTPLPLFLSPSLSLLLPSIFLSPFPVL